MTRRPFGGGPADVATVVDGSGRLEVARNAWVTVYTASTGGTVADLLAVAGGAPVSAGRVGTDAFGMIGAFSGPDDGSSVLWGDAGSGDRVRMDTTDLPGRVTTLETETSGEALQSALTAEISRATTAEALLVPQTRTVNGHLLSANVTVTAADVGAAAAAPVQSVAGKTGAVSLVKADVGLGNVDNTADAGKPVSTAQATAIAAAQAAAIAGAPVQSVAGKTGAVSLVKGDVGLSAVDNTSDAGKPVSTAQAAAIAAAQAAAIAGAPVQSVAAKTGTVSLVKADVGLGSVDNTADTAKPVSTAQQAALDLKAPLASPAFTGTPSSGGSPLLTQAAGNGTYQPLLPAPAAWTSGPLAIGPNTVDASGGNKTPALPTPTLVGQLLVVEKVDATTNTVTISGTIRGSASTLTLALQFQSVVFEAESLTSWRPIAGHKTLSSLDGRYSPLYLAGAVALGNVSGTVTLDATTTSTWTATLVGDVTFNFVNVPASGRLFEPLVLVTQDGTGGHAVSFQAAGSLLAPQWDGIATTAAQAASASTSFVFQTIDGGTSWLGRSLPTPAAIGALAVSWGTAAPTSGGPYAVGAIVWNSAPAAGLVLGWECTVAGSPGTWVDMGVLDPRHSAVFVNLTPSTAKAFQAQVQGDSQTRYDVAASGLVSWGSGSAAKDVTLGRDSTAHLHLTGTNGITVDGPITASGGVTGTVTGTASPLYPYNGDSASPTDAAVIGWAFDPLRIGLGSLQSAGVAWVTRVVASQAGTISNIIAYLSALASSPTTGQNFGAVFNAAGTQVGITADVTTTMSGTTGLKTLALVTPITGVKAGDILYVYMLNNAATTMPQWGRASGTIAALSALTAVIPTKRFGQMPSAATSVPGSITVASLTVPNAAFWAALS